MFSKLIIVLAIASRISAFGSNVNSIGFCKCEQPSCLNSVDTYFPSFLNTAQYQIPARQEVNSANNIRSSRRRTELGELANSVPKGKYPVTLQNYQSMSEKKNQIYTSHVSSPVQNKQGGHVTSFIPKAKTIAHTCTCYKTIVRPRVQYQLITVPTIQRFIQTFQKPTFENIRYETHPANCVEWPNVNAVVQRSEIPIVQNYRIQTVQVPSIKTVVISQRQNVSPANRQSVKISQPQSQ